jgi:hypothetical protein
MLRTIIFMALLTTSLVAAQPQGPHGRSFDNQKEKPLHDFTPEQIAQLQTKQLTLALDLTPSQQSSVNALQLKMAKNRDANGAQKKDGRLTSDERYSKMISHLDAQIEVKNTFKAVLTADQYATWQKMQHRKGTNKRRSRKGKRR